MAITKLKRVFEILHTHGILFLMSMVGNYLKRHISQIYYFHYLIAFNRARIYVKAFTHRLLFYKKYRLVDYIHSGYAIRAIDFIESFDRQTYLVTADVGDDTVSVFPIRNSSFDKRIPVRLPDKCAPIGISSVNLFSKPDESEALLLSTFNFDETDTIRNVTDLGFFYSIDDLLEFAKQDNIHYENSALYHNVLKRQGHWGFRCVNTCVIGETVYVASCDRSTDMVCIIEIPKGAQEIKPEYIHKLDIGYDTNRAEPVFVEIASIRDNPVFIISQRCYPELTIISKNETGKFFIKQRVDVRGQSRSSVTVGKFRSDTQFDIALALWGGDPNNVNEVVKGELAVLLDDGTGSYSPPVLYKAGVHPTDVVSGDFDGDGLDEIAVLNYGSGLNYDDRIDPGSIQIFKYVDEEFTMIEEVYVPYPRIGVSKDLDNDGKDELFVSLFFDKCLVAIKYFN